MATSKLMLTIETVENGGLIVSDRIQPGCRHVFVNPRGFYEWLCQEMGVFAKQDSYTTCGRVVVDANKYERLLKIAAEVASS